MNIDYYAPSTTQDFREWVATEIHTRFPDASLVAVHDEASVNHVMVDVDDNERWIEVITFTSDLSVRYLEKEITGFANAVCEKPLQPWQESLLCAMVRFRQNGKQRMTTEALKGRS